MIPLSISASLLIQSSFSVIHAALHEKYFRVCLGVLTGAKPALGPNCMIPYYTVRTQSGLSPCGCPVSFDAVTEAVCVKWNNYPLCFCTLQDLLARHSNSCPSLENEGRFSPLPVVQQSKYQC